MWSSQKSLPIVSRNRPNTEDPTASHSNLPPRLTESHRLSTERTLCMTVGAHGCTPFNTQHMARTNWGQNGHSASPNVLSSQEGSHFYPQQRKERRRRRRTKKKKKNTQYNAASRKASRRIARAPRLSCLYKQALIFLSSSGTSAIYSQPRGWGPAGLEKFCYSPVRPLRPVCENRFHL